MVQKDIIFNLLQQVFIWPEEKIVQLTRQVQAVDVSQKEKLQEVIEQLEEVIIFQKKALQKAQEVNPSFYPKLTQKIKVLYKKECSRISEKEQINADKYLKNKDV